MEAQNQINQSTNELDRILDLIKELNLKSEGRNYIYRGERKPYPEISSSLYRQYKDIDNKGFDIGVVQTEILAQAKLYTRYTGEIDDFEILSQLQHYGGETNLIDFTTDILIALFFACDGEPNENGQVILLSETGANYTVNAPTIPVHRVLAQKSVFVRPNEGFVKPNDVVAIPKDLKPAILDYLRINHDISVETIYNDLHGFIKHRRIHQSTYALIQKGGALANKKDYHQAIEHFTNAIRRNPTIVPAYNNRGIIHDIIGRHDLAINDYKTALEIEPEHIGALNNLGVAYIGQGNYGKAIQYYNRALEAGADENTVYNRGETRLYLEQWGKAEQDLAHAKSAGIDIVSAFRNDYANVADFERKNNVQVPTNIAEMLGG